MGYAADLMIFNEELFATLIKRVQEFKPIMLLSDVPGMAGYCIVPKNAIMAINQKKAATGFHFLRQP